MCVYVHVWREQLGMGTAACRCCSYALLLLFAHTPTDYCLLQVYALVVQGRMRDACKLLENHSERRNKKGREVSNIVSF